MEPARVVWHTPAKCMSTLKRAEKHYFVPAEGAVFLFTHLAPSFLVEEAAMERSRQQHSKISLLYVSATTIPAILD